MCEASITSRELRREAVTVQEQAAEPRPAYDHAGGGGVRWTRFDKHVADALMRSFGVVVPDARSAFESTKSVDSAPALLGVNRDHDVRYSASFGTNHPPKANLGGSSLIRSPEPQMRTSSRVPQESERFASPKPLGYPSRTRTESRSLLRVVRGANRCTASVALSPVARGVALVDRSHVAMHVPPQGRDAREATSASRRAARRGC